MNTKQLVQALVTITGDQPYSDPSGDNESMDSWLARADESMLRDHIEFLRDTAREALESWKIFQNYFDNSKRLHIYLCSLFSFLPYETFHFKRGQGCYQSPLIKCSSQQYACLSEVFARQSQIDAWKTTEKELTFYN